MFHWLTLSLAFASLLVVSSAAPAFDDQDLRVVVYTEDYPPFNFPDPKTGEIAGSSTEKVTAVLEKAGISFEIKLLPWQRAVRMVKNAENALIYTIARTTARENQYRWLMPIAPANFYIYMKSDDKRVPTYEALKTGEYTASCVAQDITCDLLNAMGIPEEKITAVSTDTTGDFRLVMAGRSDIFISDRDTFKYLRTIDGFDMTLLKKTLPVNVETGFYLAGGLNLSDAIAQKIIDAHMSLETTSEDN